MATFSISKDFAVTLKYYYGKKNIIVANGNHFDIMSTF